MKDINKRDLVSFELSKEKDKVEIHGSPQALRDFSSLILKLAEDGMGDAHLMTASWGGEELSEEKLGISNELLNHVKIFCWAND